MRKKLKLFFTASFLFLSSAAMATSMNVDDDNPIPEDIALGIAPAVPAAPAGDLVPLDGVNQYFRIINGERFPLYDETGNPLPRIETPVSVAQSGQAEASAPERLADNNSGSVSPENRWSEKLVQPGNITTLALLSQIDILERLAEDPIARCNLLRSCRYYAAFALPFEGRTHSIANSLKQELVIDLIAQQTGDFKRFMEDQRETFQAAPLAQLQKHLFFSYYKTVLQSGTDLERQYGDQEHFNSCSDEEMTKHHRDNYDVDLNNISEDYTIWYRNLPPEERTFLFLRASTVPRAGLSRDGISCACPSCGTKILQRLVNLDHKNASTQWRLDLHNNELKILPKLNHMMNLKELVLYKNKFSQLPQISGMAKLEGIGLGRNCLKVTPVFRELPNLRVLDLSCNLLTVAPDLSGLPNLTHVSLTGNKLTTPPVLTGLLHLIQVNLDKNKLTMPPVLSGLVNLTHLNLAKNKLTVPPVLTGLGNLINVNLNNNQLSMPPVLTGVSKLRDLDLSFNSLNQLPDISELVYLETLHVDKPLWENATLHLPVSKIYACRPYLQLICSSQNALGQWQTEVRTLRVEQK